MRYLIAAFIFCMLAGVGVAQDDMSGPTVVPSETEYEAEALVIDYEGNVAFGSEPGVPIVMIPFPDQPTTFTFALTDPDAPDGISLVFDFPTTTTLAQWQGEVMADVATRVDEAEEAVRGLGGDASAVAIAGAYQAQIQRQADIERRLQRYLNEAVKIRFVMEILRRLAGAQGE